MIAGIRKMPQGEYTFEDHVEGDGFSEDLIKIKVKVEVKRDIGRWRREGDPGRRRRARRLTVAGHGGGEKQDG